nr:DUF4190 domain-containing protein [Planosporangium flavigriseum]
MFAGFPGEERQPTSPNPADGAGAGPAQPIRPTFVTPRGAAGSGGSSSGAPGSGGPGEDQSPVAADGGYAGAADGPAPAARWNALAVASVVAILTWTPIPLVLGLLALGQIRRRGQRGKRLALAGVAVGAIFVVIDAYIFALPHF